MLEHSKGFRTGRLVKVHPKAKFENESTSETPFIAMVLESEIPIGFGEVVKEQTNVLLLGEATVSWWEKMLPTPKVGDTVKISYATMYVKNNVLCMRVQDPSLVEVTPQKVAEAAPGLDTYETINATDFFRAYFAARENKK